MSPVQICVAPSEWEGDYAQSLTTDDWSHVGWTARPADRRGLSLISDALESTGVDWRVNPCIRLDVEPEMKHLIARLSVAETQDLYVGNAHLLNTTCRNLVITLSQAVSAGLTLFYEDGFGSNDKNNGIADYAQRMGWPHTLAGDCSLPQPQEGPVSSTKTATQKREGSFPDVVPTSGFPYFRHDCLKTLAKREFANVDREYKAAYRHILALPSLTPEALAEVAETLPHDHPALSLTRLRGSQAACFKRRCLWKVRPADLHTHLDRKRSRTPRLRDYERLLQLRDPQYGAIAVLSAHGLSGEEMVKATLVVTGVLQVSGRQIELTPLENRVLEISAATLDGPVVDYGKLRIAQIQKFLRYQFNFPLGNPRGGARSPREPLAADSIQLAKFPAGVQR